MDLTPLSWMPNRPSLLLRFADKITILLDCAFDIGSISAFLPYSIVKSTKPVWMKDDRPLDKKFVSVAQNLKMIGDRLFVDSVPEFQVVSLGNVDPSLIDVILVSNWMSLMALPFITEKSNFRGTIYSTEPTVQFGRLVIEEFMDMLDRVDRDTVSDAWKPDEIGRLFLFAHSSQAYWSRFYNKAEMESSLAKITNVFFNEIQVVNGLLRISAISSGYAIGSSNWIIETDFHKMGYMASTSFRSIHVKPADLVGLCNLDTLFLTSLSYLAESTPDDAVKRFSSALISTLDKGGNVLIPIAPTGIIYDLFELVIDAITNGKHTLPSDIPIYFISPVAESTLAYANIYSEWLAKLKSEKAYEPEDPFRHSDHAKRGRIKVYENLHGAFSRDYRSPCVVFTGHPSLRVGDVVHFLELWGKDPKSSILMTDPDYPINPFYDPYKSLSIRAYYFPIDTKLDRAQLCSSILQQLSPKRLVLNEIYMTPANSNEGKALVIRHPNLISFVPKATIHLPAGQRRKRVIVESKLLNEMRANIHLGVSKIDGLLYAYDNNMKVTELPEAKKRKIMEQRVGGKFIPEKLVKTLAERKVKAEIDIRTCDSSIVVKVPALNAQVHINEHKTLKIACPSKEYRDIIRNAIQQCFEESM